jgi:hypothetical protein
LVNEFELINKKNTKKIVSIDTNQFVDPNQVIDTNQFIDPNQVIDEILDNYLVNESKLVKKEEIEDNEKKDQIETIQMDEIDFGTSLNDIVEKYTKDGKIKIINSSVLDSRSQITKPVDTKSNEIKIGKKKR